MALAYAVPRMLERNGLTLQDFDFYEIHEAFASQVLATLKRPGGPDLLQGAPRPRRPLGAIDRDKLNVNGSRSPRATCSPRPAAGSSTRPPSCSPRRGRAARSSRSAPPAARGRGGSWSGRRTRPDVLMVVETRPRPTCRS